MALNADAIADIEGRFKNLYPRRPTSAETQSLSGRLYRSISWLKRAMVLDGAPRLVALWIALNALYGLRPYGVGWDSRRTDLDEFTDFLDRLLELQGARAELGGLLPTIERDALALIGSQFLWKEYWSERRGFQHNISEARNRAKELRKSDPTGFLLLVYPRLQVLRNQVFHGSAAENTRINLATLNPALRLLESMVPVFLRLMIDSGGSVKWPAIAYPPTGSPQEPRVRT
jgi:hypothetical protein